jgi:predicted Zn-dependent protease
MSSLVRLNASESLYTERPDLLVEAAGGVYDVIGIQGTGATLATGGLETASVISQFEAQAFNPRRGQLDLDAHLKNLAAGTDVASTAQADIILTDSDLYAEGMNFVFGVTFSARALCVESVARFTHFTKDIDTQKALVRHVARHEYGHLVGMLKTTDYANPDKRGDIYEGHCANTCTMQQIMSVGEAVRLVERLSGRGVAGFCMDCVGSLQRKAR